jgi:hypothetical protein
MMSYRYIGTISTGAGMALINAAAPNPSAGPRFMRARRKHFDLHPNAHGGRS